MGAKKHGHAPCPFVYGFALAGLPHDLEIREIVEMSWNLKPVREIREMSWTFVKRPGKNMERPDFTEILAVSSRAVWQYSEHLSL